MPNWCQNEVQGFTKEMYKKYADKNGNFDFNKLCPMPKELERTISGGVIDECVAYYILKTQGRDAFLKTLWYDWEISRHFSVHIDKKMNTEQMEHALLKVIGNNPVMYPEEIEQFKSGVLLGHTPEEIGKLYYELREKYGALNWYDWRRKNWGTKWNACNTEYYEESEVLCFSTAWNEPTQIFELLAKAEKDKELTITTDADIGGEYEHAEYSTCDGELHVICKESVTFDEEYE